MNSPLQVGVVAFTGGTALEGIEVYEAFQQGANASEIADGLVNGGAAKSATIGAVATVVGAAIHACGY